ncbi:MAG: hypothetical protein RLZZ306_1204 [Bacteroidota bacterium]|jgi:hypothetical protein
MNIMITDFTLALNLEKINFTLSAQILCQNGVILHFLIYIKNDVERFFFFKKTFNFAL